MVSLISNATAKMDGKEKVAPLRTVIAITRLAKMGVHVRISAILLFADVCLTGKEQPVTFQNNQPVARARA